jgi:alpha-galactosidase
MQHFLNRRVFLRDISALGASVPVLLESALGAAEEDAHSPQIENGFMTVAFDAGQGRVSCRRRITGLLLKGAVARANLKSVRRSTAEPVYRRVLETVAVNDTLGTGRALVVRCSDTEGQLDFLLRFVLYAGRDALLIEAECHNVSPEPVIVRSLEPLCATPEVGSGLLWPGTTKVLTNGAMYYDPGRVAGISEIGESGLRSWWNVGLFRGYDHEGLVCGSVENKAALGQVIIRPGAEGEVSLVAESVLANEFVLPPGRSVKSNSFWLQVAPSPYQALETYAQIMGELGQARQPSILNGWCDWAYAFEGITEAEMVANAEFAARALKQFGLEYIQVDEGFQRWHGDWEGNAKFPHGMKWLANKIRSLGLKPGIWLAPYVVSEPAEVYQKHPEWMLREPDGRLKEVMSGAGNIRRFALDITHPGAAEWLYELFETVAKKWGYELIKIDFVDWSLLSAERYHDASVTRAEAYRKGIEIMRRAIGPKCHLLDCGPGPVSVGMLDSMRIELDQPPVNWKQYFLDSASTAPAMAKRYYFHKRTWVNDADHVCLGLLTIPQAQSAATLVALSGGNMISGDRLPDLDLTRLEILKKVFPSYGEAARPVDLFDTDRHSVFALRIEKPFGTWTIAGFFNRNENEAAEHVFPLNRLWLDPAKTYLAFDFWRERFHGEITREIRVKVPPSGVTLLALHEKRGVPQVLSTDRHVLQGAVELEQVTWNSDPGLLEGTSLGPLDTAHNVWVYIPEAHPWFQGGPFLFHDFPGYALKMMDQHILQIRVRFRGSTRIAWTADVGKLIAASR